MPKRNNHTALLDDALEALGKRPDLGFFWKQNTGGARAMDDPETIITYGLPGAYDITGLLNNGYATRGEIEIKTGTGKLSDTQKTFTARISHYEGHFLHVCKAIKPEHFKAAIQETIDAIELFIAKTRKV